MLVNVDDRGLYRERQQAAVPHRSAAQLWLDSNALANYRVQVTRPINVVMLGME